MGLVSTVPDYLRFCQMLLNTGRGEYGWDGSAGTIFWIDPVMAMIAVLMTQSVPANPDSLRQQFKTLVEQALIE